MEKIFSEDRPLNARPADINTKKLVHPFFLHLHAARVRRAATVRARNAAERGNLESRQYGYSALTVRTRNIMY